MIDQAAALRRKQAKAKIANNSANVSGSGVETSVAEKITGSSVDELELGME